MLRFLLATLVYFVLYQLTGSILASFVIVFVGTLLLAILMLLGNTVNREHYNEW